MTVPAKAQSATLRLGTLADGSPFEVPLSIAVMANALLAVTGAGKSNAAVVFGERLFEAGVPWVAIDAKGDWHGIRYGSRPGQEGLPIPVFGGLHGNMPLEPGTGARMAELIVDKNLTCVLDVSEFESKAAMLRFLHEFGKRLYALHGRTRAVRHLFLEECDEYCPQHVVGGESGEKNVGVWCLSTYQRIVRRGRQRGLGCTMISQRSAVVNKDVLTQTQTLFALAVSSPQDRKAVRDWVDYHGVAKELVDSLPTLEPGEAWVISPRALKTIERITFDQRWTLDTGDTPEVGGKDRPPVGTMADIDLAAIKEDLVDVVERAKENDPAELRKELTRAHRDLGWWNQWRAKVDQESTIPPAGAPLSGWAWRVEQYRPGHPPVREVEPVEVRVPFVPPKALDAAQQAGRQVISVADAVATLAEMLGGMVESLGSDDMPAVVRVPKETLGKIHMVPGAANEAVRQKVVRPNPTRVVTDRPTAADAGDLSIGGPHRKIVAALMQKPDCDRNQLALLAGYHVSTKSFVNALGALRSAGYVEGTQLTDKGRQLAYDLGIEPVGDPWEHWYNHPKVGGVGRSILDHLSSAGEAGIERDALAELLGYHPGTKSFVNTVGRLRTLGLVSRGWPLRLSELLAP